MKFNELPITTVRDIDNGDCYIIANVVKKDDDGNIIALDKCLIPINSFAQREEIMLIGEQSTGFVDIINKIVNNYQEINKTLSDVKEQLNNIPKLDSSIKLDDISLAIKDLQQRLDNSIVEI